MSAPAVVGITVAELRAVLAKTDPAAVLTPRRLLQRIIKRAAGLTGFGLQVPHRKSFVIERDALLEFVSRQELGLPSEGDLPATLLLIAQPDVSRLRSEPAGTTLLAIWRLLFHARIHQELDRLGSTGPLTPGDVHVMIEALGRTEFAEVRSVLGQENMLLRPSDFFAVFSEFTACYLELAYFDRRRLRRVFPALDQSARVNHLLSSDLDPDAVFKATRLEGASDPVDADEEEPDAVAVTPVVRREVGGGDRLLAAAAQSRARGNRVRAAMRSFAAAQSDVGLREEALRLTDLDLKALTDRLQRALGFGSDEAAIWRSALEMLLPAASGGVWPVEARLLFDLQRVCLDHEREVYSVDVVEWILTWGQRPLRRHLPQQRFVLVLRHLRRAAHRLPAARLSRATRQSFAKVLSAAVARGEERLRDRFRPPLREALSAVGLVGHSYAERVGRDKLVEEVLDRVAERGLVTLGDVRDALARNRLKLNDLSGVKEFLLGDALVRLNRQLAVHLDGVYRRGEIYLRWLQRMSSLGFGTRAGRFLTRYLVLPFGGAFVILKGLVLVLPEFGLLPRETEDHLEPYSLELVAGLGLFLFGLLYAPWFRARVVTALTLCYRGIRLLSYDGPLFVLRLPGVRLLLGSRIYLLVYQLLLKPLAAAGLCSAALLWWYVDPLKVLIIGAGTYLAAALLLNSPAGLRAEEDLADRAVRGWLLLRHGLVPGLINSILSVFRRVTEQIERLLYAVDEWLRFRTGDSKLSAAFKPVFGVFWFFVTYLLRLVMNLFVEPTINPIKHFPVVTVAAKLMLPYIIAHFTEFVVVLTPVMGGPLAWGTAIGVQFFLPGLAGFAVWELKENWKLYRVNQPATLRPEMVGSHGETLSQLLRPGFHSGTLPKIFAKLRRADGPASRQQQEALHHVGDAVRRFVERGLLAVLEGSREWGAAVRLRVGAINLATNRIRIDLKSRDAVEESLRLDFDELSGRLTAGVARPGWLVRLDPARRRVLADALTGFYHLAGVDLVREQIQAALPPGAEYDVVQGTLVVWTGNEPEPTLEYRLTPLPGETNLPTAKGFENEPALRSDGVLFGLNPTKWTTWVEVWERDHEGKGHDAESVATRPVLPAQVIGAVGKR
jgi:hypothetical protein